ncbi:hypothetical protein [Streptomyces sp. 35G-GA-8]|uniref:hypothetical protein n=1 Tax=Streptomyces sp. 35G-GA-8 TaxID=2939434 RepID=UPI00201F31B8|nr:hypothetical protein [Streptomyces sp. 35G-GA-8]MCL7377421.1 hypothetical protein [Streptomyces sp. 35G-GA-8]
MSIHDTQRRSLLAAHSVALYVQQVGPIPPSTVSVQCHDFAPDSPSVDVNFFKNPEGVRLLAAALGAKVTEGPHSATSSRLYTEALADVSGIPVTIWSLADAPETGGAL